MSIAVFVQETDNKVTFVRVSSFRDQ